MTTRSLLADIGGTNARFALYDDSGIHTIQTLATADYPTPARRPADSRLDCSKIHTAFGIDPSDWQSALGNLADYL